MLQSPGLFLTGINISESLFRETMLPEMRAHQKNPFLFVYLDSHLIEPYEFKISDLHFPHFGGVWSNLISEFAKIMGLKKSRSLEFEKIKDKNIKNLLRIKSKNKIDKKPSLNKSRPKVMPQNTLFKLHDFFRKMIETNFLKPIDDIEPTTLSSREQIEKLFLGTTQDIDWPFVKTVITSQLFFFFIENDFY